MKASHTSTAPQHGGKPRVVILGGGFGGAYCAQHLERFLGARDVDLALVDRHNFFIFYPLLVEAGTGSLEARHAVVSIRDFLKRTDFHMGRVTGLDLNRGEVHYGLGEDEVTHQTLGFDHLVISLGSVTLLPNIPGLRRHAFQMKSLTDAVALRDHAIRQLEMAEVVEDPDQRQAMLRFVVVGANFTGVEVAGELDVFLKQACKQYKRVHPGDFRVTLIDIADRILPALDSDLSDFAAYSLKRRGLDILLSTSVAETDGKQIRLETGETLSAQTLVWCAGIEPNPLISSLDVPTDERGYILCDDDLRVQGMDSVWAIGDCAVNRAPDGKPYPATAQHAVGQARVAAQNIVRTLRGKPTEACTLSSKGVLAALGCRTAVARIFGIKLSGFWAWFVWRTLYLFKMPGWSRRIRVALDWTLGLLFKRNVVQLGVHRKPQTTATKPNRNEVN